MKALDLKYAIATSVNVTEDLNVISQQSEKFGKLCDKQWRDDERERCFNLKIPLDLQATDSHQDLKNNYKCSRVERAPAGFLPFAIGLPLKTRLKYLFSAKVLPTFISAGTVGCMGIREVMVDKELHAIKQQQMRIATLMLNITDLEYNQVEGQINGIIDQQEISMEYRNIRQKCKHFMGP